MSESPTTTQLADGQVEFILSTGRRVVVRELNGLEQANADGCCDVKQAQLMGYYRTAHAIVSIDGVGLPPVVGKPELSARLQRLRGREVDELAYRFNQMFGAPLSDDILKNESAPGDSTPTS